MKNETCFPFEIHANVSYDQPMTFSCSHSSENDTRELRPSQTNGLIGFIAGNEILLGKIPGGQEIHLTDVKIDWIYDQNQWKIIQGVYAYHVGNDNSIGELSEEQSKIMDAEFKKFDLPTDPEQGQTLSFSFKKMEKSLHPLGGIIIAVVSTCGGGEPD